ncbi:TPA: transcriptional regulator [bacterium]|nr:transcriptional regulator [bacterium]
MEITDIQVKPVEGNQKLKAWASITLDNAFVVHNLKVINGQNGMFVAMPSRLTKSGEFKDVAHPITPEFRRILEEKVISAYYKVSSGSQDIGATGGLLMEDIEE